MYLWAVVCGAAFILAAPAPAVADQSESDRIRALEDKVTVLSQEVERLQGDPSAKPVAVPAVSAAPAEGSGVEQKVNVLARELDRLKRAIAVPEDKELKSVYGMGPAASKVYLKERGLSIGGYGEANYTHLVEERDGRHDMADALRAVLYVGYKFNDWIVMNSEFEFEHAGTGGGGSVSTEFLLLDFLLHDAANVRTGLLLAPMGFTNEIHEPTYFYGVSRPSPETTIIPTTWREIGAGLFGNLGSDKLSYKLYAMTGLNGAKFSSSGVRGGRQKGSRALADDWALTARLDYEPTPGLLVGGSLWSGPSAQEQYDFDLWTTIWELHAQWKWRGLHTRALLTMAHIEDAGELTSELIPDACEEKDPRPCHVAERMLGGYVEIAYDVLPHIFPDTDMRLEPFYRWEISDTQNKLPSGVSKYRYEDFQTHVVGLQFYPHPQVVIKANYRNVSAQGLSTDGRRRSDDIQLGIGFVF